MPDRSQEPKVTPAFDALTLEGVQAAVTHERVNAAVRESLVALQSGKAILPDQVELKIPNGGELHIKGGFLLGSSWIVFKVATGDFPGAPHDGFSLILDAATGRLCTVVDDHGWLTAIRTGAAGAIATDALARIDAVEVAVLGTGEQAASQVEALRHLRPNLAFSVWGRDPEKLQALADRLNCTPATSAEAAVRGADIVITTTSARTPVLRGDWLAPGTHITAVGADMAGKRELDTAAMSRADVIVCDDVDLALRVGELQHLPAAAAGAVPLGAVLVGTARGRTTDDQITVADICGLGVEDVAVAELVAGRSPA
jgi:ornithine cyclodeaminase